MHDFEKKFADRRLTRGGAFVLSATDALELINDAEREGVQVLGLDAFRVRPSETEPVLEHSIDYSRPPNVKRDAWDSAKSHIISRQPLNLSFEVVLE